MSGLLIVPPEASQQAGAVDTLYFVLIGFSAAIIVLVVMLVGIFAIRYRRGSKTPRPRLPKAFARELEVGWTVTTLFVALALFWWVSASRLLNFTPLTGTLDIRVVAKQWMWTVEHPSGAREINEMHLPVDVPVRLLMTSQDVIHSFYVPAFRVKQDVLPDRITTLWFTPSRLGRYALRCAEYCGTDHALMTGDVVIQSQADYAAWSALEHDDSLVQKGGIAFRTLGCAACHTGAAGAKGPSLLGLYGGTVTLADGRNVTADDLYLTESLTEPRKDVVKGYDAIMPSYRGVLNEDQIFSLLAYLKSLGANKAEKTP